ncbi:MAG: YCF48-related protein, partial [Pseudomonadota bacterium]
MKEPFAICLVMLKNFIKNNFLSRIFFLCLLVVLPPLSVYALQDKPLASVGVAGGPVYAIAVTPDKSKAVYIGTGSGIYKSVNGEDIWKAVNEGLGSTYVYDIVPNTITGTILYASTKEGIFKTTDDGNKWATAGLADYQTYCLAVNPVTITYLAVGTPAGIFRSTDGGTGWTKEPSGPSNVYSLAINPQSPLTVYAGSFGAGVYKSTDFGASWTQTGNGPKVVNALAINPTTPAVVYAGTDSGLYKTTDSGTSWSAIGDEFADTPVYSIAIPSSNASIVYIATDTGVYTTTDAGSSWKSISSGIPAEGQKGPFVREIVIDPRTNTTLYAGTYSGSNNDVNIYKSTNSGSSWTQINRKLSTTVVNCFAFNPNDASSMFAGTSTLAVLKSNNGGQSWTESNEGITNYLVRAMAVNPASSNVYAGTSSGLFISSDTGETWEAASPNPEIYSIALDPHVPENIYTGTNRGIFLSSDEGKTWFSLNNNLTNPYIYSIVFHPEKSGYIYAGTNGDGIFKSTSGGAAWSPVNEGLDYLQILTLAIAPSSPYALYAGTKGGGVYISSDEGTTWEPASSDFEGFTATSIAVNPADMDIVYAAMENNGFYRNTDGGQTWEAGAEDIADTTVYSLALDPRDSQTLFVALAGNIKTYTFNLPPYVPSAPNPSNEAVNQPRTTTLRWSGGDPDKGESISYNIYFGTDKNFDNRTAAVATASYTPSSLQLSQTYYWKVTAVDSHAAETEGDIWKFTTAVSNPPDRPSNPSPANGAQKQSTIITL